LNETEFLFTNQFNLAITRNYPSGSYTIKDLDDPMGYTCTYMGYSKQNALKQMRKDIRENRRNYA